MFLYWVLFPQKRDREGRETLPCKVQWGKEGSEKGSRPSGAPSDSPGLGPPALCSEDWRFYTDNLPHFWLKRSWSLHTHRAAQGRYWPPSTKHLVRTYCGHRIGPDQGRLEEAHKKAFLEGNKKGLKKDHAVCWEQVPGDNRPELVKHSY